MSDQVERFLEDNADGSGVQGYLDAVEALQEAGLVSEERARHWEMEYSRSRAAGHGFAGPHDDGVSSASVELLEELFVPVRPRTSPDWDPEAYHRYQAALSTLQVIGALPLEESLPWSERQTRMLASPERDLPQPPPQPELPFAAAEMSALLIGPSERHDGLRITAAELYADCVIVRMHWQVPLEPEDPVEARELLGAELHLHDDLGTEYEGISLPNGNGAPPTVSQWPELLAGWQAFVPGTSLNATALTVEWRGHEFELPLASEEGGEAALG